MTDCVWIEGPRFGNQGREHILFLDSILTDMSRDVARDDPSLLGMIGLIWRKQNARFDLRVKGLNIHISELRSC